MLFNLEKLTKHVMISLTTHINNVRLDGNKTKCTIYYNSFYILTKTIAIVPYYNNIIHSTYTIHI